MADFLERLGIGLPIVQAGMGGGVAGPGLAAAVSEAGGLGTLGMASPGGIARQLAAVRGRTDRPVAVNLLLPFARTAHWQAAADADVVVTFWGNPSRRIRGLWVHQAGSVEEARAAYDAGADAVIVQGVEAGGHVRGSVPALDLLADTRAALPDAYPLLLAGGIADADDVARALAAGAVAAVSGTRFLMSEESGASAGYKARVAAGGDTVLTELFGVAWPGKHRVLPNLATERWLHRDPRGPAAVRLAHRVTRPVFARVPDGLQGWMLRHQRLAVPLYTPVPPTGAAPDRVLETSPLYAGTTAARIGDVPSAAAVVRGLTPRAG